MAVNILTIMPDSLKARAHVIDDKMMRDKGWYDGWHESWERMDAWVDVFKTQAEADEYLETIRTGNY